MTTQTHDLLKPAGGFLGDYWNTWINLGAYYNRMWTNDDLEVFDFKKLKLTLKEYPIESTLKYFARKKQSKEKYPEAVEQLEYEYRMDLAEFPERIERINTLVVRANHCRSVNEFLGIQNEVERLIYGSKPKQQSLPT